MVGGRGDGRVRWVRGRREERNGCGRVVVASWVSGRRGGVGVWER